LENVTFEETLLGFLGKKKKGKPVGDCQHGYESVIEGVRLFCGIWQADAILVSAGTESAGNRTRYEGSSRAREG
jgi:hypothetical protein